MAEKESCLGMTTLSPPKPEQFIRENFQRLDANSFTAYLILQKLNDMGFVEEANDFGLNSFYGLSSGERAERVVRLREWLVGQFSGIDGECV